MTIDPRGSFAALETTRRKRPVVICMRMRVHSLFNAFNGRGGPLKRQLNQVFRVSRQLPRQGSTLSTPEQRFPPRSQVTTPSQLPHNPLATPLLWFIAEPQPIGCSVSSIRLVRSNMTEAHRAPLSDAKNTPVQCKCSLVAPISWDDAAFGGLHRPPAHPAVQSPSSLPPLQAKQVQGARNLSTKGESRLPSPNTAKYIIHGAQVG